MEIDIPYPGTGRTGGLKKTVRGAFSALDSYKLRY